MGIGMAADQMPGIEHINNHIRMPVDEIAHGEKGCFYTVIFKDLQYRTRVIAWAVIKCQVNAKVFGFGCRFLSGMRVRIIGRHGSRLIGR